MPLTLYGDGARFARIDSLEIVAFSLLLSKEATWVHRIVSACFVKSAEYGTSTWQAIWDVLVWSLNAVFAGRHPELDHLGRPWPEGSYGAQRAGKPFSPEGFFGVVHRICGDLDWYHKRLGLRVASAANLPCAWCDGGRPPLHPPFLHLEPHAAWIPTIHVPPRPAPSHHPIWQITGVSQFTVGLDLMHTLDLGVLAHFEGSVLHSLLFDNEMRGTLVQRESELWQHLRASYSTHKTPTRITSLQRSLWCDPSKPHVTWPVMTTKAAENRQLLVPILELCRHYDSGSPRDAARVRAAEHLRRLQATFDAAPPFLSEADVRSVEESVWAFCYQYHALSAEAATRGVRAFHIVNKFHMLIHLTLAAKFLNPRLLWTYGYEDLVGRMKRIAVASKSGLKASMLTSTIFLKYRRVLFVSLKKAESAL